MHDRFPLLHGPTPLEALPRLSEALGGPKILVKRDDLTGLALGGNKVRKLEYLVAQAIAEGATTLVTAGARQSNHTRQTAAAAAKAGLKCDLVLTTAHTWGDQNSGNYLLDRILGPTIHLDDTDAFGAESLERVADEVRARGERPFVIPVGGSSPVGVLGYVRAAEELLAQAPGPIDAIIHAAGSGGTTAGLCTGLAGTATEILAVDVLGDAEGLPGRVGALTASTEKLDIIGGFASPGYGLPTDEMLAATRLVARTEGLLLDPIYTGKAMAALIAFIEAGRFDAGHTVVFLHTGGMPGIFTNAGIYG